MSGPRSGAVLAAWNNYRAKVIPKDAPAVQLLECRRAFYAGAETLLSAILRSMAPGPDVTQADEDYIAAVHNELLAFAQDVKEGRA
jgi:hypothetical protein